MVIDLVIMVLVGGAGNTTKRHSIPPQWEIFLYKTVAICILVAINAFSHHKMPIKCQKFHNI